MSMRGDVAKMRGALLIYTKGLGADEVCGKKEVNKRGVEKKK